MRLDIKKNNSSDKHMLIYESMMNEMMHFKKYAVFIFIMFTFNITIINAAVAEDSIIRVFADKETGVVNKKVLGNNFLGFDRPGRPAPMRFKHIDFGTGIWDPVNKESVSAVVDLAKSAGLTTVRIATLNHYDWKKAVGKVREHYLYGIDEILKTLEEIGAEPVFTISYFVGNEQDAADFVEYLNAPDDNAHPWAAKRAMNGHPEPYNVKYFEFGNEVFVNWSKRYDFKVTPERYAAKYLLYQKAMKNVDTTVQLGLNLHHYKQEWDQKVLEKADENIDFVIRHIYPPKDLAYYRSAEHFKGKELFEVILGSLTVYTEKQLMNTLELIRMTTGRTDIQFAITEYNVGLIDNDPPYRYTLGASLVNAELLRIFMKPGNKVLMANHLNFINGFAGMLKSEDDYMTHDYRKPMNYIKRPGYYVYELYSKYFGDKLIDVDVKSSTYDMEKYRHYMKALNRKTKSRLYYLVDKYAPFVTAIDKKMGKRNRVGQNLLGNTWKRQDFPGVRAEEKNGVLEIDFVNPGSFNYFHSFKQVKVEPATYYKLSGYIKTENLIDRRGGVSLTVIDGRGWALTRSGVQTDRVKGTNEWLYVDAVYKTLPDADSVKVIARRTGTDGPLKGKAFFKDVRLEKYTAPDTIVPYLSVNASKSENGNKIYLMVINKNMDEDVASFIELVNVLPSGKVNAWVLNGPSVDATNEKKADNVGITHKEFKIRNNPFQFIFEAHSLTAIEINVN